MADRKITQIMPAAGWGAAFDTGEEEQISPLVGWALVQEPGGGTAIVGLVASEKVELCDAQDNFAGYVYLADILSDDFVLDDDDFEDDDDEDDDLGGLDEAPRDGPAFGPTGGLLN